jgi:hypothetical protein
MTDTMMREPTPAEIASFEKAAKNIAKLGRKGFWIYLANDNLNLMVGPSHDQELISRPERIRSTVVIPRASGGDW